FPTHQIARNGIAWVPEERRILPNLTVLDNLRLGWLATSRESADAMSPKGESDTRMGGARGPFRRVADAMSPKGETGARWGGARGPFRGPRVDEVFEYFPRLRERIPSRAPSLGRRAADACDRAGAGGPAVDHARRRADRGPRSDARSEPHRDPRRHQP